ncbi:MAG: PAS domain S-box protein, partial [Deltaproteobacteria bacterium]|nr:PAS domain S-box protein [Deltaproteobacteria bacterium]
MNYISDESVAQWVRQSKNLLDSLNIGFNLVDMGDNILEVNDSFLKMTESRAEDIIGHNVSEFYKKADYEKMRNLEVSLQKQGNFQYEFFVTTTSREKIPALINISTIVDREGRPIYQLSLITDIREQKKIQAELETLNQDLSASKETLQNEKNKLEAILFGIGDCVTVFDRKGNLILSNPKGKEIRGERLTPLLSLESGNRGNIALSIGNENRHFFAQIEAIQNTQGKVYAFAEILRDITDQKRLAEKEQELFRLTQEMKRNKLESEFIGVSRAMQKVF